MKLKKEITPDSRVESGIAPLKNGFIKTTACFSKLLDFRVALKITLNEFSKTIASADLIRGTRETKKVVLPSNAVR